MKILRKDLAEGTLELERYSERLPDNFTVVTETTVRIEGKKPEEL